MIWEVLVGVGMLPLPPVMDHGLGIILLQWLSLSVLSLEIQNRSLQVDCPLFLKIANGVPTHLAL